MRRNRIVLQSDRVGVFADVEWEFTSGRGVIFAPQVGAWHDAIRCGYGLACEGLVGFTQGIRVAALAVNPVDTTIATVIVLVASAVMTDACGLIRRGVPRLNGDTLVFEIPRI